MSPFLREWSKLNPGNDRIARDRPGIGLFENQIIVLGGSNPDNPDNEPTKLVESFSFETNQWTVWSSQLNIAREGPGVIQVEDQLYVIGGRGSDVNGSVEVWHSKDSTWRLVPELSVKHFDQEYVVSILQSQC